MPLIFEPKTDEELAETRNAWLAEGCRIVYVDYCAETFSSVMWDCRLTMLGYPANVEPLLTLPSLPRYRVCLIDVIGKHLNSGNNETGLEVDELTCVQELPSGWKLSTLRQYFPGHLPDTDPALDFCRLNWYLGIYGFDSAPVVWVHPEYDRCLSLVEWESILAKDGREGFQRWANNLATAPAYSDSLETSFDMRQHAPRECFTYANERRARVFNRLPSGKQRFEWDTIAAHFRKCNPDILQGETNDSI